uniref:Expressed protein n=1 Tax=Schizophyllum commune (strain H4-8 / FGSC 9210) TaxID=578458 RepID=D8Q7X8_SCHCM
MREYERALEETLQARRELKRVSKMARWWKRRAGEKGWGEKKRETAAVQEANADRTSAAEGQGERSTERKIAAGRVSCEEREPAEERATTEGRGSSVALADAETGFDHLGEKRTSLFGLLQAAQADGKAKSETAAHKKSFNKPPGGAPTNRSASAPSAIPARTSRLPTLAGRRASNASIGRRGSASSVGSASFVRRGSVDSLEQTASSPTRSGSSSPSTLDPVTPVRTSSLPGTGIQKPAAMFKSPDSIVGGLILLRCMCG